MTITAPADTGILISTVIETVDDAALGVATLVLRREDGHDFPAWEPGSHIDVILDNGLTRQYSLCSDPADLSTLRIGVLHVDESRGGSEYVHEHLKAGTSVTISAPRNNFPLVDSRKYLFIAGGIGITPIIPMIRDAEAAGREWTLHYLGRSRSTMAFSQQLVEEFGADRVHLHAADEGGRLKLQNILGLPRAHMLVYTCGPAGMLSEIEDLCMGWPPGVLHTERFSVGDLDAPTNPDPFDVELALTGTTVTVNPNETILDAIEANGGRALSSCRAGLCGTCETRVISGEPEHRDAILSEEDKDAGDVMMVCVSRAAAGCHRLVLEL